MGRLVTFVARLTNAKTNVLGVKKKKAIKSRQKEVERRNRVLVLK